MRVVARIAADIAEVQTVACRQQDFQKQVAVVQASCAVAAPGLLGDQVEAGGRGAPGQGTVVQAEQADVAERQAAHGHHAAEGDHAGEKARGAGALVQRGHQAVAYQFDGNVAGDAGGCGLIAQGGAGLAQQQQGIAGLLLVDQRVDQLLQAVGPLGQRPWPGQFVGPAGQALDETGQKAEQLSARALQGVQRPAVTQQRWRTAGQLRRGGKAQQQAVQALLPGKGLLGRQTQAAAMRAIPAPAHAGVAQPVAQQRQVFGLDTGAAGNGRQLQPAEQLFGGEAALRQIEQGEKGLDQRQFGAQAAVGQAEGNPRHAFAGGEHCLDKGRIAFDVRRQHHHLIGRQRRVGGEAGEQLVVQHLDLAQWRMADMQLQRAVVLAQVQALISSAAAQTQDVLLQGVQQAVVVQVLILGIEAGFLPAQAEQAVEEVAALLAQAGQQGVAHVQVPVIHRRGSCCA